MNVQVFEAEFDGGVKVRVERHTEGSFRAVRTERTTENPWGESEVRCFDFVVDGGPCLLSEQGGADVPMDSMVDAVVAIADLVARRSAIIVEGN